MTVHQLQPGELGRSRSRLKAKAAASIVAASVSATSMLSAGPASADDARLCMASGTITASSLASVEEGVTLRWYIEDPCGLPKDILLNGIPVGSSAAAVADGEVARTPSGASRYTLTVRRHNPDGTTSSITIGSSPTIVVGNIREYRRTPDGRVVSDHPVGVSEERRAARQTAQRVLRQIKEPYASRLMGKSIGISIIPTGARLTELPYWNSLAGLPTADGRPGGYDAVRGVADTAQPKIAVGAETLGAGDIGDPTSPGYALTHELGHLVLMHTAGPEDMRVLADTARRTQIRAGGPFVGDDSYTKFNVDEYWAEGTAAHFTVFAKRSLSAEYSQAWLKTNDRNLWQLICNVYRGCAPA